MKPSKHFSYFCGDDWDKFAYFSPKSFLAAFKGLRAPLKRHHAALFDEYLFALLKAVKHAFALDPFGKGYLAADKLFFCCQSDQKELLGMDAGGSGDKYAEFMDLADGFYKKALETFKDDFLFHLKLRIDFDNLDNLYAKLSPHVGEGTMEWLLSTVQDLFFIMPLQQSFRRGYMQYCLLRLTEMLGDVPAQSQAHIIR